MEEDGNSVWREDIQPVDAVALIRSRLYMILYKRVCYFGFMNCHVGVLNYLDTPIMSRIQCVACLFWYTDTCYQYHFTYIIY